MIERFLRATMKGLEFTSANVDEALDIVMKYAPNEDSEHMRYMLTTELEDAQSALTDTNGIGWMTARQWQELHDSLLDYGALTSSQDVEASFTDQFLNAIYDNGALQWP